jgi:nitrite reductase (NO-forming)
MRALRAVTAAETWHDFCLVEPEMQSRKLISREQVNAGVCVVAVALTLGCGGGVSPPSRSAARILHTKPPVPAVQLPVHRSPRLFPSEAAGQRRVRLDASYGRVDLGAGRELVAWSFGGVVPGPTLRVRVGDRIFLTMTNRSDEPVAALSLPPVAAQTVRLAGVIVDREDEARSIGPGQTLETEFTALQPGVHLYQGSSSDAAAMATGAFGMLIIDPAEGFTTRADREYAIVQNELYVRADPAGRQVGGKALLVPDLQAMKDKHPSHLGYGGVFAPGSRVSLDARPGERLRLYLLNAGVNVVARFQMGGLPFERVWPADILGAQPTGAGPAVLAPEQGAILEVAIPPGRKARYPFGDQQLSSRGLGGIIDATGGEPEPRPLVAHGPLTPAAKREAGHALFAERCVTCHQPPPGMLRMAPDLAGVAQRRNRQWLTKWLSNPPKMQAEDADAQQLMKQWNNVPMPDMLLSPEQVDSLTEFLSPSPVKRSPPRRRSS